MNICQEISAYIFIVFLIFFSQVILILTKLYDFHLGSVTESTLWRWAKRYHSFHLSPPILYTVKINVLYLIKKKNVATDYKQYY